MTVNFFGQYVDLATFKRSASNRMCRSNSVVTHHLNLKNYGYLQASRGLSAPQEMSKEYAVNEHVKLKNKKSSQEVCMHLVTKRIPHTA